MKCTKVLLAACAAASVAAWSAASLAGNVYPTNLGQSTSFVDQDLNDTTTLSYLLNDDATGVTVEVLNSSNAVVRTFNAGAQAKGTHSVVWDAKDDSNNFLPVGDYTFRVNTTGAASGGWSGFSTDNVLNNFEIPRGVAVNKNPDSPYYGRVYVSNGRASATAGGRPMSDGVFMLNADMTDSGISGGTGPHTAGITTFPVSDTGGSGPFRLEVGPDDSLYITDWSDAHSDLWQTDPNVTSATQVLDSTGRDGSGLNATHGSIADVIVVGTGAGRTIYTIDEDFAPAGSVLRYDIGMTSTFVGAPTGYLYEDTANEVINSQNSIALASDGTFWLSQDRAGSSTDTASSLIQFDSTGTILWESVPSLAANSLADPLRATEGMAYDPVNNLLALVSSRTGGVITIFDPDTKTVLDTFNFGSTTNTDVAFDNAGNLYVGNRSAERVRLWGPPNGNVSGRDYAANAFSTSSLGPLGVITVVPEPASVVLAGLGLLGVAAARRRRA
jgi:hypothetical protein